MRQISPKVKAELILDPRMKKCCVADKKCLGRIEWHHVWTYGGKQIDRPWAIVGICHYHHSIVEHPDIKKKVQTISIEKATIQELAEFPKKDWAQIIKSLT
jgi:hypothetical protein